MSPRGTDVRFYPPPLGGVIKDKPEHLVPQGYLTNGYNVYASNGSLAIRSGYTQFASASPGSRIMGGGYFKTSGGADRIVVGSLSGLYRYSAASNIFKGLTTVGSRFSGTLSNQINFAVFRESDSFRIISTNDTNFLRTWDGIATTETRLPTGDFSTAKDICVAANRVIAANIKIGARRYAHRLRISDFNTASSWDSSLVVDLSDTPGEIVGVETLTRTSFAIYKEDSKWLGIAQGGVYPFRFEMVDRRPGAVSPRAIVPAEDGHYYMGNDLSFYLFNSTVTKEIGQQITQHIKDNINWSYLKIIHGAIDSKKKKIWWFYPGAGQTTCNLAVSYNYVSKEWQTHAFANNFAAAFPARNCSGGVWTEETVVIAGDEDGNTAKWNNAVGDGAASVKASFTFPLTTADDLKHDIRLDGLDVFFNQTTAAVNMNVSFGITDSLASITYGESSAVDLSVDERHLVTLSNAEGRFATTRHSFSASEPVKFLGAVLFYNMKGLI